MTQHHCKHPVRHRLFSAAAVVLWTAAIALYALPTVVYELTHSAGWAFLSIALALTLGRVLAQWLAYGHCHPRPHPWGLRPLRALTVTSWIMRGEQ